jgi:hypothetical protein
MSKNINETNHNLCCLHCLQKAMKFFPVPRYPLFCIISYCICYEKDLQSYCINYSFHNELVYEYAFEILYSLHNDADIH